MIHPINIPEDLLSVNPRRPQFFRPKPKVKISYGRDGRKIGSDGAALEPISPNTYWQDVFMRTFIRRLMPSTNENEQHLANLAMPKGNNNNISHVDIVDLSPSSISSSSSEEKKPTFLAKKQQFEEEESDGRRKDSQISSTSSNESSSSVPDRRSSNEFGASSTEEEEAVGDGLIQMGNRAMRQEMDDSQRISRKAIKSMLKECCQREETEKMEEFARFDFSHLNLFGMANLEENNGDKGELLELVPETKGSRVWMSRRQPRKIVHFEGESMEEKEESNNCIQFNISFVKIRPAKKVEIQLEAHNSLQNGLQFQLETHLHKVEGQKIGQCLRVQNQMELLKPGKETPIHVNIVLDGKMRISMEKDNKSEEEEQQQFIMATMHGKVMDQC